MKRQADSFPFKSTLNIGAVVMGIVLVALVLVLQARMRESTPTSAQPDAVQPSAERLDGAYAGIVELDWALSGVYSDTLFTPEPSEESPPSMGAVDLGFVFHQDDGQGDGHVDLSSTLIFTGEHTIMTTPVGPAPGPGMPTPEAFSLAVGPAVDVSLNGADLIVESERFAMTTSAGQKLQRQFRLNGIADTDNSHRFTGEYRETIWGFGPQPLTLLGRFTIEQPSIATSFSGDQMLYLPILQR